MTDSSLMEKEKWLRTVENYYESNQEGDIAHNPGGNNNTLNSRTTTECPCLYHYTSLPTLFKILEKDYLWASGTRFSNDSSEELLSSNTLFQDESSARDNFIICFSGKQDLLSQWRGYCFNGGVSIEFDFRKPADYSILHADYETSQKYELAQNVPFKVRYIDESELLKPENLLAKQIAEDSAGKKFAPWVAGDIIPYLKDQTFFEEAEWRLLFGNRNGSLAKCVRFRDLKDGSKVPYVIVKAGDVAKDKSGCGLDLKKYTPDKFDEMLNDGMWQIYIPQGHDQEAVYYALEKKIMDYNKNHRNEHKEIQIVCKGHLPIRRITVAPTYDRERIAEKIKRYCWSIYWLRNVEVETSSIPYIPPSE